MIDIYLWLWAFLIPGEGCLIVLCSQFYHCWRRRPSPLRLPYRVRNIFGLVSKTNALSPAVPDGGFLNFGWASFGHWRNTATNHWLPINPFHWCIWDIYIRQNPLVMKRGPLGSFSASPWHLVQDGHRTDTERRVSRPCLLWTPTWYITYDMIIILSADCLLR